MRLLQKTFITEGVSPPDAGFTLCRRGWRHIFRPGFFIWESWRNLQKPWLQAITWFARTHGPFFWILYVAPVSYLQTHPFVVPTWSRHLVGRRGRALDPCLLHWVNFTCWGGREGFSGFEEPLFPKWWKRWYRTIYRLRRISATKTHARLCAYAIQEKKNTLSPQY